MTPEHRYDYILAIDPSGNFNEGHGTTGWSLIDYNTNLIECDYISAIGYDCSEEYWNAHVELITKFSQKYHKKLMVNRNNVSSKACDYLGNTEKLTGLIHKLNAKGVVSAAHKKSALDNS